jgi:hypothetical protein
MRNLSALKILTTLLIIFISLQCRTQNSLSLETSFPVLPKEYKWPSKNDEQEILKFLKTEKEKNFSYFNKDSIEYGVDFTKNGLIHSLHLIDLNKDGIDEIIFSGLSDEEGNRIDIFKKEKTSYTKIFSSRQNLTDIIIAKDRLFLYISDPGCCAEYSTIHKIFKTDFNLSIDSFKQTYQSQIINGTKLPDSLFKKAIRFKVTLDAYKVRFEPKLDDSTKMFYDEMMEFKPSGNIIAKLPNNTVGNALGYRTDQSGTKWWFVEINENARLKNVKYERTDQTKKYPTHIRGWINSKNIQKLN